MAGKNVAHRARALELDNVRQHHRNWPSLGLKSGGPSAKVASHGVDELVMVVANAFPDDWLPLGFPFPKSGDDSFGGPVVRWDPFRFQSGGY